MNHIAKTIIIGTNHHNTLSMVRSFGEEGEKVILYIYGAEKSYIASSIYVESVSFFKSASDSIDAVSSYYKQTGEKPVIIACSDEISSLMDKRYDELISKCYFFNAGEAGRITSFMDKQKQLELAKECGFSAPTSVDALPKDVNIEDIKYPCLVKPKASIYGGKNISICHSMAGLKSALAKYNPDYNVLVQDYIRKEYEIVVLGLSVSDKIIVPGFIQKHREERGGTTYATVRSITELNQKVVDACRLLIKEIGYQGLWGIECIKQGDEYFFLELNMRNDATTYAMKVAGVNLPYIYQQMVGGRANELTNDSVRIINSMVEFNDFNFVLKRKVNLFRWIREYKGAECKYFHSGADSKPCMLMKNEYLKFLRKRILKF